MDPLLRPHSIHSLLADEHNSTAEDSTTNLYTCASNFTSSVIDSTLCGGLKEVCVRPLGNSRTQHLCPRNREGL